MVYMLISLWPSFIPFPAHECLPSILALALFLSRLLFINTTKSTLLWLNFRLVYHILLFVPVSTLREIIVIVSSWLPTKCFGNIYLFVPSQYRLQLRESFNDELNWTNIARPESLTFPASVELPSWALFLQATFLDPTITSSFFVFFFSLLFQLWSECVFHQDSAEPASQPVSSSHSWLASNNSSGNGNNASERGRKKRKSLNIFFFNLIITIEEEGNRKLSSSYLLA